MLTDWSTQLHVYSAIDKKILVYLKKKTRHIIGYFKRDGKDIKEKLKYKTDQLQLQIKKSANYFTKSADSNAKRTTSYVNQIVIYLKVAKWHAKALIKLINTRWFESITTFTVH